MLGAITGDIVGSIFEFNNIKTTDFSLFSIHSSFTDDTVLTIAVADCILNGKGYIEAFKYWGRRYPYAGYGGRFRRWLFSNSIEPYNSFGNGSAMRVSPVGFAFDELDIVLNEAKKSAEATHNHPEGIKGAQATASAIFLARQGKEKKEIKSYIKSQFNYNLDRTIDEIRPLYGFDETCQGTVPEAIIAFLESDDFEDAIRKAISLGGDSDTLACITGGIAQAFYKDIPQYITDNVKRRLTKDLLDILEKFEGKYSI
ncbi:MAG: ADP-ribosylglycohydrolase family protein [Candidatus Poribacteria bacterium]|nr:ADP-ribosylglycohydrolase family protein [Candidatus Poribacteria bacterium]